MLKKKVSCKAPECTNWADKNSSTITVVTIIIMLLLTISPHIQNPGIFNTWDIFKKPCLIYKILRHIDSPSIIRTVYSCDFRHIQRHPAIFSNGQAYWGTFKDFQALLRHVEPYPDKSRTLYNSCICNRAISEFLHI